jgi:phosphoglycolate phosphatase
MTRPYSCILFDLDGTIIDSAPGITATLAFTYEALGRPIPSPSQLLEYVGPPILDSFRDLGGMTDVEARQALAIYRVRYLETGVTNATVYDGVTDLLREIHESGVPLSLATSKPESLARLALEYLDVAPYLDLFTGASEDEKRSEKADVVEEALLRLTAFGADISNPVMVGDRHYDILGAGERGVPTIFVEWGYGSPAEQVGAIAVASDPAELRELLLGEDYLANVSTAAR